MNTQDKLSLMGVYSNDIYKEASVASVAKGALGAVKALAGKAHSVAGKTLPDTILRDITGSPTLQRGFNKMPSSIQRYLQLLLGTPAKNLRGATIQAPIPGATIKQQDIMQQLRDILNTGTERSIRAQMRTTPGLGRREAQSFVMKSRRAQHERLRDIERAVRDGDRGAQKAYKSQLADRASQIGDSERQTAIARELTAGGGLLGLGRLKSQLSGGQEDD